MPELFPILRVLVDEDRRPGRFLLLGSATPQLRLQSAESLAGRLYTLELFPFTLREVVPEYSPLETLWIQGSFPLSLLADGGEPSMRWRNQYLRDIVERDLRLIGFDLPPAQMHRFLRMLAHNHGQPVVGYSWEGFVIEQISAVLTENWDLFFWRTSGGAEIDLVLSQADQPRIGLEIKMNTTDPRPSRGFFQGCRDLELADRWVAKRGSGLWYSEQKGIKGPTSVPSSVRDPMCTG